MKVSSRQHRSQDGLTLVELLAVLGALALLAAITLPALAGGRPRSEAAVCANNLRMLGAATLNYSMENEGTFPPRSSTNIWPQRLLAYYEKLDVLRCPSDRPIAYPYTTLSPADAAPRSYLINGWNDYFVTTLAGSELQEFLNHRGPPMPEAAIPLPSQTILFGEKMTSSLHFHMDLVPNTGNDYDEVEYGRHDSRRGAGGSGGSNFTMADGSVRMLLYGQALFPENLWAVVNLLRTNIVAQ